MNCANHPEVPASAFCRECGKPMCSECQRLALGSVYCAEHLPAVASPPPRPDAPGFAGSSYSAPAASPYPSPYAGPAPQWTSPPVVDGGVHPGLAFILGFIPGVGAIYNGQYAKGLIHAVIFGILVSLISSHHTFALAPLLGIMIAAWVLYQPFEAFHTARKRRYGQTVEEFSSLLDVRPNQGRFPVGALLLIVLGFLLLLDTTDIISLETFFHYWPALLIVLGLYLLYNRLGAGHPQGELPPSNSSEGGVRR
jgi:TM2 domain-containing membrane protein YozV